MAALLAAGPVQVVDALPGDTPAPLDRYPQAHARELGTSKPPAFLDDDETVVAHLGPDGGVRSLEDIVLLKMRGAGDYVIVLPGVATSVRDLGGDTPPALQDGHVTFLGSVFGPGQLGAQATLDRHAAGPLPLGVSIGYSAGGHAVDGASLGASTGPVGERIEVHNLTGLARIFVTGSARVEALAEALDHLRQAAGTYTPETDMQAVLPLPPVLEVAPPARVETHQVLVPFSLVVTAKVAAGETVTDAGGADVTRDSRGTTLTWRNFSPRHPDAPAVESYSFTVVGPGKTTPAVTVRADPLPHPAAVFSPPTGGGWSAYLATRNDTSAETLLAQEGAAAFHRVQELRPPLDRPGSGPEKVKYSFILDSGVGQQTAPPRSSPRAQPWAVALAVILLAAVSAGAYWAWSRH